MSRLFAGWHSDLQQVRVLALAKERPELLQSQLKSVLHYSKSWRATSEVKHTQDVKATTNPANNQPNKVWQSRTCEIQNVNIGSRKQLYGAWSALACVCVQQQDSHRPQVASDPYILPWHPAQLRPRRMDGWPSADAPSSAAVMSNTGDRLENHGNAER